MGGGGGGGSTQIEPPNWGDVGPFLKQGLNFEEKGLGQYIKKSPLMQAAQQGALGFWDQLPGLIGQIGGFGNQLTKYQQQLGTQSGQLTGLFNKTGALGKRVSNLYGQFGNQATTLGDWLGSSGISSIIQNQGALTPGLERDVSQATRNIASAQGNARSAGALGTELLNRDSYRQQRLNTALQQGQGLLAQQGQAYGQQAGLTGLQSQLYGQQAGILGQKAGLTQLGAGLTGQKAGLIGQIQGLQTGGLNQLIYPQNAAVSQFVGLQSPVVNTFGAQQQANIAQAQLNQQGNQAGDAKGAGIAGGAINILGSVAAAY